MKQTVAVRAVIRQDQKVLLLRRAVGNPNYIGLYELPGGYVAFGEEPKATLQHDILQQTGRETEDLQLFDAISDLDTHDATHQYIVLSFLVSLKPDTEITLGAEHDKYEWKHQADIQLNDVTETTRRVLELEHEAITGVEPAKFSGLGAINTTKNTEVIIYSDGGSRGNPGPSASGFVIQNASGQLIFEGGKYLGITTNNQAEYKAVLLALEKALEVGGRLVHFRLDSQLVANQLNGVYKIKHADLWPIYDAIKQLQKKFQKVTFTHVRREFNKDADAMVNKILDEHI